MIFRRILHLIIVAMTATAAVMAQPSATYYKGINGKRQVALKLALKDIISDHKTLSYSGELPKAYELVYYCDDNRSNVYDIFSYDTYSYSSTSTWNKEHVVPNSWWNGVKNAAYSDIFSVIPSEKTANNRKSNFPIGTVGSQTWSNGCIKVGKPVSGQGGTYNNVFEPADEYKGDFARIYFYVATCYSDIGWGTNSNVKSEISKEDWPTLNPWLYQLLLKWHNQDPVSQKEIQINNSAESVQGNRNPFIDYPVLADYIWGTYQSTDFNLSTAVLYQHISGSGPVVPVEPVDTIVPVEPIDTIAPVDPSEIQKGDELFAEYFDELTSGDNTSTSGSADYWSGNTNFPMVSATYQAGGAVKLATSKKEGSLTSRTIDYAGGPIVVELAVKGWSKIEGSITVSLGSEQQVVEYKAKMTDKFETIRLIFNNVPANPILTVKSPAGSRCFVDYVVAYEGIVPQPQVPADVNHDGTADTQDVLAIYEFMQNYEAGNDVEGYDVNSDGTVDTQDVLTIYDYIQTE